MRAFATSGVVEMFKPSFIILAVLLGLGTCYAQAVERQTQVWQGKIGSAPIVMELTIDSSGEVEGRYFYRKYKFNIFLEGEKTEQGDLRLTEKKEGRERGPVHAHITLTPQGQGWQGEWREEGEDTKTLPVTLLPLDTALLVPAKTKVSRVMEQDLSPYDVVRLTEMSLRAGEKQEFMGYTLLWMEEPVTKLKMFQVRDGFPDETLLRINAALKAQLWKEVESYFGCSQQSPVFHFEQIVTPRFLNQRLLSASIATDLYCGGAHPSNLVDPLNLDIESGKVLVLEDLLWLTTGKPYLSRDASGRRKNHEYETKILGQWLAKTMTRFYAKEIKADAEERGEDCDYSNDDMGKWSSSSWYLTEKGIYFHPSYPHVIRYCAYPEWSIVPWNIINQHPGRLKNLP